MAKKEQAINKKEKKGKKDKTSFFKGFKAELKKVNWPSAKQLANNTLAVIVIVLFLAAIVFVLDITFEAANKYGLDKIKESVVSSSQEQSTDENASQTNEGAEQSSEETTTTTENQVTSTDEQPAQ